MGIALAQGEGGREGGNYSVLAEIKACLPRMTPSSNSPVLPLSETGSPAFARFLELLGDEVLLDGFELFRGGLDNKSESTTTVACQFI